MGDKRRSRRTWGSWASGAFAAVIAAAALLGTPATAAAVSATAQGTTGVPAPAAHAVHPTRVNGAGNGTHVVLTASDPSTAASSSAASRSALVTQLGEARRANGVLGQWVVVVLLGIVVALWVALVAVVVRVRMRTAPGARSDAGVT